MNDIPPEDRLGHLLLEERLGKISELLFNQDCFDWSDFSFREDRARSFVVCGLGSSAAHARYLSYILQRHTAFPASFLPVSAVADLQSVPDGTVLVVISQGLSPNSWLALEKRHLFQDTIVLTAVSEAKARHYKSAKFCERLAGLHSEGVHFLRFPLEAEYDVLIRLVGPMLGYYACLLLAKRLAPEAPIDWPQREMRSMLKKSRAKASPMFETAFDDFDRGMQIVTSYPLSELGTNLCFKVMEGLFCPSPALWNYLDLAHGLLQKIASASLPVWVLESADDSTELVDSVVKSLERVGCVPRRITSSFSRDFSIFEFEMLFNHLVVELIKEKGIDQRNWPGKGADIELYAMGQARED
jgi:creatinine amidohydrolase